MAYHLRRIRRPDFSKFKGQKMQTPPNQPAIAVPPIVLPERIISDPDRMFDTKGYTFDHCLGRGAQGQVWLAYEETYSRGMPISRTKKALKFMVSPAAVGGIEGITREAELVCRFFHENVIRSSGLMRKFVSELPGKAREEIEKEASANGISTENLIVPIMPMEYVNGRGYGSDLRSLFRRLRNMSSIFSRPYKGDKRVVHVLDIQTAAFLASRIFRGLEYIHERFGKVHQDVKPENILIDDLGVVKVSDFALSDIVTEEGEMVGTPDYMAPEQMEGRRPVMPKSDVYSTGLILYESLMGGLPWYFDEDPYKPISPITKDAPLDILCMQIFLRAKNGFRKRADGSVYNEKNCFRDPEESGIREIDTPQGREVKRDVCDFIRRALEPDPEKRPTAGESVRILEKAIYRHGFGPTNNSLAAHCKLYEEEPLILTGLTPENILDLRYTCKNPKGAEEFAKGFPDGDKPIQVGSIPQDFTPQIARPYISAYMDGPKNTKLANAQAMAVQQAPQIQERLSKKLLGIKRD